MKHLSILLFLKSEDRAKLNDQFHCRSVHNNKRDVEALTQLVQQSALTQIQRKAESSMRESWSFEVKTMCYACIMAFQCNEMDLTQFIVKYRITNEYSISVIYNGNAASPTAGMTRQSISAFSFLFFEFLYRHCYVYICHLIFTNNTNVVLYTLPFTDTENTKAGTENPEILLYEEVNNAFSKVFVFMSRN